MPEVKIQLGKVPIPSTYFDDVTFVDDGDRVTLRFAFERDERPVTAGIRFGSVCAHRFRAESHCTSWHVDAYDRLLEVQGSAWVEELLDTVPPERRDLLGLKHYLICVDSTGCYEVVGGSWEFLPETEEGR